MKYKPSSYQTHFQQLYGEHPVWIEKSNSTSLGGIFWNSNGKSGKGFLVFFAGRRSSEAIWELRAPLIPDLVTLSPDGGVTWRAAGGMIDLTLFVDQNVNRKTLKRFRQGSTDLWLTQSIIIVDERARVSLCSFEISTFEVLSKIFMKQSVSLCYHHIGHLDTIYLAGVTGPLTTLSILLKRWNRQKYHLKFNGWTLTIWKIIKVKLQFN